MRIEQGKPEVEMIQHHQSFAAISIVVDDVPDPESFLTQSGFHRTGETEILTESRDFLQSYPACIRARTLLKTIDEYAVPVPTPSWRPVQNICPDCPLTGVVGYEIDPKT